VFVALNHLVQSLQADVLAVQQADPAATDALTVVLCYPGLHALWGHRLAHVLWRYPSLRLVARWWAHHVRCATGIEIHPAAQLGQRCVIDHGMGVVIGETAVVGNDVLIFQGVTLGGTGKLRNGKRHPSIGHGVTLGANATVLGNIHIGDGATIGASAVVTRNVPAGATVKGLASHQTALLAELDKPQDTPPPLVLEKGAGI
jgi:serine O-acetyltransferase